MSQRLLLDPRAVADAGRAELDLTTPGGALRVGPEGPQWGDAAIEATMADGAFGSVPVDHVVPNRQVEIPLVIVDTATVSFDDARRQAQEWVALVQREHRGWIGLEVDGVPVYIDVVSASLRFGGGLLQAAGYADSDAVLVCETLPERYGPEVELGRASGNDSLVVALADVGGDYPARVRVAITDTARVARRGLLYAIRPQNSAATAAMEYAASQLTPLGGATRNTRTGTITYASLPPTWVAAFSTRIDGVGDMTHIGPHRVWVLASVTGTTAPAQLRLEWADGSGLTPTVNAYADAPSIPTWLDLGEIQLDRATRGAQRWEGRGLINAEAGASLTVYSVLVLPIAHAYGWVNAGTATPTSATVVAWDDFTYRYGTDLNGLAAPAGGPWVADAGQWLIGADGVIGPTGNVVQRVTTRPDAAPRLAILSGVSAAATVVRARIGLYGMAGSSGAGSARGGLVARYRDANNWLVGIVSNDRASGGAIGASMFVLERVAGATRALAGAFLSGAFVEGMREYQLIAGTDGSIGFDIDGVRMITVSSPNIATGGALARGAVGLYDECTMAGTLTRQYDRIFMSAPAALAQDAVLFSTGTAELATTGYCRADATGTYAPLVVFGDLPRLPPSGAAGGAVEVYVRAARAAFGEPNADTSIAGITATVYGRPCYLFTSGA